MGVQQTFGGIARVVAPVWAGFAFDHLGHAVPFWTSSVLVAGTILLGMGMEGYIAAAKPGDRGQTTAPA
jgi:hypothetical protein